MVLSDCFPEVNLKRGNAKNLFHATRVWLRKYRLREESQGQVVIDIPPAPSRGLLESSYTMLFALAAAAAPNVPSSRASAVIRFWELMVQALQIREILVIYNTPNVRLLDNPDDDTDLWTGMGEVEAALLIGEHLSQLQPKVRLSIRRWRDMKRVELETKGPCMILLGSALNQPDMEYLCDRDRWRPLQKFHFTSPPDKGRSFIHRGRRPEGPLAPHGPYQYREKASKGGEMDFALVSFFRNEDHQQTLIGLQGISTSGTLGAARYMFDETAVKDLRKRLCERPIPNLKKGIPSFELILKVPVNEKDRFPEEAQFGRLELYPA